MSDRACTRVTPRNLHGKEGVDGSSPSEGSAKRPSSSTSRSRCSRRAPLLNGEHEARVYRWSCERRSGDDACDDLTRDRGAAGTEKAPGRGRSLGRTRTSGPDGSGERPARRKRIRPEASTAPFAKIGNAEPMTATFSPFGPSGSSNCETTVELEKNPSTRNVVSPVLRMPCGAIDGTRDLTGAHQLALVADVRFTLSREDQQDLLGAVGMRAERVAGLELEQHGGGAGGAGAAVKRERDAVRARLRVPCPSARSRSGRR